MFNKMRLKSALVEYKKRFVQTQWPDEKYKWEAVKCFQVNWDVNADDFAARSLPGVYKPSGGTPGNARED